MVKLRAEIYGRTNTHKGGGLRNNGYECLNAQQSRLSLIIRARRDWSSQSSKIVKANDMCPTATFCISIACVACGIVTSRVRSWRKVRHTGRAVRCEGNNLTNSQSSRGYLHYSPANLSTYTGYNFKERIPSTTGEQCLHSS